MNGEDQFIGCLCFISVVFALVVGTLYATLGERAAERATLYTFVGFNAILLAGMVGLIVAGAVSFVRGWFR